MKNPLDTTRNVFLTGQAGTGKTYILQEYIESHPNTLVCASTGTAATALGGTTMHRLFSIPVETCPNPFLIPDSSLKVFSAADTVIIDEISMCRADTFSFAIQLLKRAEKLYKRKVRVILSGDFLQLPPVVRKEEEGKLRRNGFDPSGFAFTTPEWSVLKLKVIALDKIYRQDNLEYIDHLGDIRKGVMDRLDYFDQFVSDSIPDDAVRLCGTNAEADAINKEYLEMQTGNIGVYLARKEGRWTELSCEETLVLKEGMQVMFTANDFPREGHPVGMYQNGIQGIVKKLHQDSIDVMTGDVVITVYPYTWYSYRYRTGKDGRAEKIKAGTVRQLISQSIHPL